MTNYKNTNDLDDFRFAMCEEIFHSFQRRNCSVKKMAKNLNVPRLVLDKIFDHRTEDFSTDTLLSLHTKAIAAPPNTWRSELQSGIRKD